MDKMFSPSRWLALLVILLLVVLSACVRSKPSPTPIPIESPQASTQADVTPTGGTPTVFGLGPAATGTEEVPTGEVAPASEATPSVAEAAPTAVLPEPTEVPSVASGAGSATGGQVSSYTVQEGDTVYSIARRFNTTPEAIAQFNNLANPDSLVVGQTLQIPSGEVPPAGGEAQPSGTGKTVYTVQPGDTMFSIAQRYHTTVDAISSANQIYNPWYIYVGQQLVIPGGTSEGGAESAAPSTSSGQGTYVVQAGDTLWSISARFGTTPQALAALNNLSSFGFIYPGQVLQLP